MIQSGFDNLGLEQYAAAQFLIFADNRLLVKNLKVFFTRPLIFIIYFVLIVVSILIGYLAYQSPTNTLWQSYYIEIAAGGFTFLLFPLIFLAVRWNSYVTYGSVLLLIFLCACLSYFTSSVTQSFLIEAATSFTLLLVLDFAFDYLVNQVKKVIEITKEKLIQFQQEIDEARETLSPDYSAFSGGTTEETIQVKLVEKHIEICQALCSDEPYWGNDLVSVITNVNDFKKNYPDEFSRIKQYFD